MNKLICDACNDDIFNLYHRGSVKLSRPVCENKIRCLKILYDIYIVQGEFKKEGDDRQRYERRAEFWVSTKELLPQEGEHVLLLDKYNTKFVGYYSKDCTEFDNGCFVQPTQCKDSYNHLSNITHWRLLPRNSDGMDFLPKGSA